MVCDMTTNRGPGDTLAGNIRAEMARQRLTQSRVAGVLGISQAAVSRRLTGSCTISAVELQQLSELLEVPVADLLSMKAAA